MKRLFHRLRKIFLYLLATLFLAVIVVLAAIPLARIITPNDLVQASDDQPLALDNVHVVDVTSGEVIRDRQVLLRDGQVESITAAGVAADSAYRRIDAGGAFLSPGLIDMHIHAMDRKYLVVSLAHGVTSVRNMGGYPMHLRWRAELARGDWLGSNLYSASPTLNGRRNSNPLAHKVVTDPAAARERVRRYHAEGWDFIKSYARLEVDVYTAIREEAAALQFDVAGHVPYPVVEADYRLATGMASIEHAEDIFQGPLDYQFDTVALAATVATIKNMQVHYTPTLTIFDHLVQIANRKQDFLDGLELQPVNPMMRFFTDQTDGKRWLTASQKLADYLAREYEFLELTTRSLYEAGVPLLVGSDCGVLYAVPGVSTHTEMRLMRDTGIPDAAVLRMATIDAARVLGVGDSLGTIEVGKTADLLLSAGNPLDDISALQAPLAVVKGGAWLAEPELAELKRSANNPSSFYLTFGRMLEFLFFG